MIITSAMTGTQIISQALRRIGNETITLDAQFELNNILDRLYDDYRWPFLKQTGTGSINAGQTSEALPANFVDVWGRNSFKFIDSGGTRVTADIIGQDEFDISGVTDVQSSGPFKVFIDMNGQTFRTIPLPDQTYTYEVVYRIKPSRISNFALVVNFPNDALLVQLVYTWALQFEDDDRYAVELQVADRMLKTYLKQFNMSVQKQVQAGGSLNNNRFNMIGAFR
jgi:hypothetical protein